MYGLKCMEVFLTTDQLNSPDYLSAKDIICRRNLDFFTLTQTQITPPAPNGIFSVCETPSA